MQFNQRGGVVCGSVLRPLQRLNLFPADRRAQVEKRRKTYGPGPPLPGNLLGVPPVSETRDEGGPVIVAVVFRCVFNFGRSA